MNYRDMEDSRLYQGGIQVEEYELCHICGDDVYEDDYLIDGEWFCKNCFNREVRMIRNAVRPAINMVAKPTAFERAALVQCLKDVLEDIDDSD